MDGFYLTSIELKKGYDPPLCRVVRRLRSEVRDDLALVEVEPPLPAYAYHTKEDARWLILAAREEGTSLFPVPRWPLTVYVCWTKDGVEPVSDYLPSEQLVILDWGEVKKRQ